MATRRSNGEGTIWYAKTEGRFRAQYPDANGHRRTISGKTKRDVEKKLRLALTKRDSNTLEEMASIAGTVEELLVSFIASLEGKREPKTIERYALDVNNYLVPTLGKLKVDRVNAGLQLIPPQFAYGVNTSINMECTATSLDRITDGYRQT